AFRRAPSPCQRNDLGLDFLRLWEGGVDYRASGRHPLADRDIKIFDRDRVEVLEYALKRPLRKFVAFLAERLLYNCPPEIEILGALLGADKAADAGTGLACDDKPLPGRRGRLRLRSDDLDLVPVAELSTQGNHAAVYLRTDASVADLRVNRISEI